MLHCGQEVQHLLLFFVSAMRKLPEVDRQMRNGQSFRRIYEVFLANIQFSAHPLATASGSTSRTTARSAALPGLHFSTHAERSTKKHELTRTNRSSISRVNITATIQNISEVFKTACRFRYLDNRLKTTWKFPLPNLSSRSDAAESRNRDTVATS